MTWAIKTRVFTSTYSGEFISAARQPSFSKIGSVHHKCRKLPVLDSEERALVYCLLTYCLLSTAYCPLPTAYCLLRIASTTHFLAFTNTSIHGEISSAFL